jgi:Cdc6-like AAA superfamily ATPase
MVVEHLSARSKTENICVACIYLNHQEAEDQTPTNLVSGLWRQLVLRRDISLAKQLYEQHFEKGTTPALDEVFNALYVAIKDFPKVYIVVDALDEYPETQRQILLDYLANMGPTVNLMITSRPHITVDSSLPNPNTLEIRATENDIRRYVDAQIKLSLRLKKLVQTRADLREEIHSAVTRNMDGM